MKMKLLHVFFINPSKFSVIYVVAYISAKNLLSLVQDMWSEKNLSKSDFLRLCDKLRFYLVFIKKIRTAPRFSKTKIWHVYTEIKHNIICMGVYLSYYHMSVNFSAVSNINTFWNQVRRVTIPVVMTSMLTYN